MRSISSNIAEGAARSSKKEFIQFLYMAIGSLAELETQPIISKKLKFLNDETVFSEVESIRRMLSGLIKFLKGKN
jgi:four helix bundle protein